MLRDISNEKTQVVIFWPIAKHDSLQKTVLTGKIDGRRGRARPRHQ